MRKTKKAYEEYLNEIYSGEEAREIGRYMYRGRSFANCVCLLDKGEYGTALRRYDPIAFEVGFREWINY